MKIMGFTLIQNITDEDSHFKLGDMDIQLYNYKNEYDSVAIVNILLN